MLVSCQDCQAKYSIADEKIRGRSARVRCRRCSALIEVSAPPAHGAGPLPSFEDPTTEPQHASVRRAAVLPRDEARARRDLFAPAPEQPAAHLTTPPPAFGMGGVAARNENSVLFSLSALGGSIQRTSAEAAAKESSRDDSGVIDLNALMATPLTARSVPPAPVSEAPVGAFTRELSHDSIVVPAARRPAARKRAMFVGLGIAAVAAAVIGLQVAARSADREAAANLPPPVTAPVAAAAAAPPAPAAAAPVLASMEPQDAKPIEPTPVSGKGHHGRGRHHAGARHASSHASHAASHPAAAPDPCHCHGNLMCAMKCSAH